MNFLWIEMHSHAHARTMLLHTHFTRDKFYLLSILQFSVMAKIIFSHYNIALTKMHHLIALHLIALNFIVRMNYDYIFNQLIYFDLITIERERERKRD